MRSNSFPFVAILICTALAGCSGSTDPATAHLFDNISNLNSGEYDRQIAQKDAEAAAIIRSNQRMQGDIDSMQRQASANRRTIAGLSQQIASARSEAASVRSGPGGARKPYIRFEKELIERLIGSLPPQELVAVYTFDESGTLQPLVPFTNLRQRAIEGMEDFVAGGVNTHIALNLLDAIKTCAARPGLNMPREPS